MSQQGVIMHVIISLHEFSLNSVQGVSLLAVHYLCLIEAVHSESPSGLKNTMAG